MIIFKEFRFEAAHFLPKVPEGHQCGRMHGHSYRVVIGVEGQTNYDTGFVVDFADVSSVVKAVTERLDHSVLNDHLWNPTAENLAMWLADQIHLPGLSYIEVWETATAGARHVVHG